MTYKLLGVGNNAKTIKGDGSEYLTAILYMTPYKVWVETLGRYMNSCPMAEEAGCIKGCLNTAGRGAFNNVQSARLRKAQWFYNDRRGFMKQLYADVLKFRNYCVKRGIQPVVRLNGTTDIRWEDFTVFESDHKDENIFTHFPDVQWYDYTKLSNRRRAKAIPNYHLTWSYSAHSATYEAQIDKALENGMNVAVVFRDKNYPKQWDQRPVINGDNDDLRFLDPKGVIVALYAKGAAKKDTTGFVQEVA